MALGGDLFLSFSLNVCSSEHPVTLKNKTCFHSSCVFLWQTNSHEHKLRLSFQLTAGTDI